LDLIFDLVLVSLVFLFFFLGTFFEICFFLVCFLAAFFGCLFFCLPRVFSRGFLFFFIKTFFYVTTLFSFPPESLFCHVLYVSCQLSWSLAYFPEKTPPLPTLLRAS
jgi:hypothetical protein